ncbi:MAG: hypothetical protein A2987_02925 [Omnitrophica bacterium RIFCSPLOWO2_01_FULL_45_10]|nr:MAG: hypothetical protein A2987_02925 [Omnitrophica bacterium RIFCSPLOWO2_01_FULL_45_10]
MRAYVTKNLIIMNKPIKLIGNIITVSAFLFNAISPDISWAIKSNDAIKEFDISTFTLPAYLGRIKESWSNSQIPKFPNSRTIIHIQDAHCNYAAQNQISNIMDYLNREYGINVVNLEGGEDDYNFRAFYDIKNSSLRKKVSDYFLKEGEINGAEFYAINNHGRISLWGVEDTGLYIENLKVYRDSLSYKDDAEKLLREFKFTLSRIKAKIYSKELLEFDRKKSAFEEKALSFKDYVLYLLAYSKEKKIGMSGLQNIPILAKTLLLENEIDFKRSNSERDQLIGGLTGSLSKNESKELVQKTIELKLGRVQDAEFYSYLAEKSKELKIGIGEYKNLSRYIGYTTLYSTLDKEKVSKEMESLEGRIKNLLYQNDAQKELDKLTGRLHLINNLLNITLTQEEFAYYQAHEDEFDVTNYLNFINRYATQYGLNLKPDEGLARINSYLKKMEKFYELSYKRDEEFVKRIKINHKPQTKDLGPKVGVLITGGFHTENLSRLFKENNISYISIMPNFGLDEKESPYFKLLAGNNSTLLKYIMANISTLSFYTYSSSHSREIYGEALEPARDNWIKTVTAFEDGKDIVIGNTLFTLSSQKGGEPIEGAIINGKQVYARASASGTPLEDASGQASGVPERYSASGFETLPLKVKIKTDKKGVILEPSEFERHILNAGVLGLDGRRFLFARRIPKEGLIYHKIYRSDIGAYIHDDKTGVITVVDRSMLSPDNKELAPLGEDVIALEDARAIERDGVLYFYLTVVRKNRTYYSALTKIAKRQFLDKVEEKLKNPNDKINWGCSRLERLINEPRYVNQNIKNFVPFGNPSIVDGREIWYALYRPNERKRRTMRLAVSEDGLSGPWRDAGLYMHVAKESEGWIGPSTFVSGVNHKIERYPLDFMLYHRAVEFGDENMGNTQKYYDLRLIIVDRNNPMRRYIVREPVLVPEIEMTYEMNGWVPGAIYSCGAILRSYNREKNEYVFDMYYSGSDSVELLATVSVAIEEESPISFDMAGRASASGHIEYESLSQHARDKLKEYAEDLLFNIADRIRGGFSSAPLIKHRTEVIIKELGDEREKGHDYATDDNLIFAIGIAAQEKREAEISNIAVRVIEEIKKEQPDLDEIAEKVITDMISWENEETNKSWRQFLERNPLMKNEDRIKTYNLLKALDGTAENFASYALKKLKDVALSTYEDVKFTLLVRLCPQLTMNGWVRNYKDRENILEFMQLLEDYNIMLLAQWYDILNELDFECTFEDLKNLALILADPGITIDTINAMLNFIHENPDVSLSNLLKRLSSTEETRKDTVRVHVGAANEIFALNRLKDEGYSILSSSFYFPADRGGEVEFDGVAAKDKRLYLVETTTRTPHFGYRGAWHEWYDEEVLNSLRIIRDFRERIEKTLADYDGKLSGIIFVFNESEKDKEKLMRENLPEDSETELEVKFIFMPKNKYVHEEDEYSDRENAIPIDEYPTFEIAVLSSGLSERQTRASAPRQSASGQASGAEELDALIRENPELKTAKMEKLAERARPDEEFANVIRYILNVYGAAKDVIGQTRFPKEPRTIFIPISEKFVPLAFKAKLAGEWRALRDLLNKRYNFSDITVIFYDGTLEDLEGKMGGKQGLDRKNAFAYVDEKMTKANAVKYGALTKKVTAMKEIAPEKGAYLSIGGHVILALGILDIVRNDRDDTEYISRVINLLRAISDNSEIYKDVKPDYFLDLIRRGDLEMGLPPITKIDMDENMGEALVVEKTVMSAL